MSNRGLEVLDELPLFTDDELLLCTPAELDTIEALYDAVFAQPERLEA